MRVEGLVFREKDVFRVDYDRRAPRKKRMVGKIAAEANGRACEGQDRIFQRGKMCKTVGGMILERMVGSPSLRLEETGTEKTAWV